MLKKAVKSRPLNKENYYTNEMAKRYMFNSVYQDFLKCEANALFNLENPVLDIEPATPLLVGNYVHSYFESVESHENFVERYSQFKDDLGKVKDLIHTKKGLRSEFQTAENMIKRLDDDNLFQYFYNDEDCEKESIVTGNMFGVPWKGKIDSLNVKKGYFCDIKTVDDLNKKHWSVDDHQWVSFFKARHYATQMGMYKKMLQTMYHKPFACYVFAVDKTKGNGLTAIEVPFEDMTEAVASVEEHLPRVVQVKKHEADPTRCEHCEYCKSTRKLTGFISDPEELIY